MKGPTSKVRFDEATKLLDYGFANFSFKQFAKKGDVLKEVEVSKGIEPSVQGVFVEDSGVLIEKGQESNVVQNIYFNENISAPIQQGQKLGEVTYTLNDKVVSKCNIIASNSVKKINIFAMCQKIYWQWLSCLRS